MEDVMIHHESSTEMTPLSRTQASASHDGQILCCSSNHVSRTLPSHNHELEHPTAYMPCEKNDDFYRMRFGRGLAVVFNHEHFDLDYLRQREGTDHDVVKLYECLTELGFDIWVYHDRTISQIQDITQNVAHKENHSDRDCLVVVVLTHGDQGILYAKDGDYKTESLWAPFSAEKCPSLAGKPKLFFIQACQGEAADKGITMIRTQTDSGSTSYKMPLQSDFLIAFSTIPGYVSFKNPEKGSWFIQILCKELNKNGYLKDLLTILTGVNRRVAIEYEANTRDEMNQCKQLPYFTSMLLRLVKFTEK